MSKSSAAMTPKHQPTSMTQRKIRANRRSGRLCFTLALGPSEMKSRTGGHVGLCIGEEKVIHAWDKVRIEHYLAVQELTPPPGWSQPQFIGWTPIERIFVGYRKKD